MDPRAEKERLVTAHFSSSRFRIAHVHFALVCFGDYISSFACRLELVRDPTFAYDAYEIYIYVYV